MSDVAVRPCGCPGPLRAKHKDTCDKETRIALFRQMRADGKACGRCQKVKALSSFNAQPHTRDGLATTCKECNAERQNERKVRQ